MCGFVTVVTRDPLEGVVDTRRWDPGVLRHRGPDAEGTLQVRHAFTRHWRLSIVDVTSRSDQPYGRDGSWLVYNGEIYNYRALGADLAGEVHGDTACLFELCRLGRQREVRRARGFFSYLYLEHDGRRVSGARDPFGKKPLFYCFDRVTGIAAFASEEHAILDALGPRPIDGGALAEYLLYKQVFAGRTWWTGIHQLAPGASFTLDAEAWDLHIDRSWDDYYRQSAATVFDLAPMPAPADDDAVERVLQEAVELRLPDEVPACLALSGGVDSSLLLRLMQDAPRRHQVEAVVTVAFPGSASDEAAYAARVAGAAGLGDRHRVVPFPDGDLLDLLTRCVRRAGGPLEHPHHLSYYVLCEATARLGKVLLTGEGADELFLGYAHYAGRAGTFAFREYLTAEEEALLERPDGEEPFAAIRRSTGIGPWREAATRSRAASREGELKSHLLTLLSRNDRMGMAHSVEVRAPFLDRDVLATALALPESALVDGGVTKAVLRRLAARRAWAVDVQRPKVGFRVPFDEWFTARRDDDAVAALCARAGRALDAHARVRVRAGAVIPPRLGWSLLNLGVFLSVQGIDA